MTRALVLFAHPCPESFSASLHKTVIETLTKRGWEVDDCDLNAEGFSPVLTKAERRGYHEVGPNLEPVKDYVERVRRAEALVLVFPVWNFGYPAILKGFFDRVFLPGVSFRLEDGLVTPRHVVRRALWHVCRPERMRYLALYDMNRVTEAQRTRFLTRVAGEMERL